MYEIDIIEPIQKFISFDIRKKELQIIDSGHYLLIYSDPFRSQALYIYSGKKKLTIFKNFQKFLEKKDEFSNEIDKIGFYETILYGTPLWSRTIYKNITQLPAATFIKINKLTGKYIISRYWNFDIKEDKSIKTISDAAHELHSHLSRKYNSLDKEKNYCMGLSGGMDSRISLAYLSSSIPRNKISLFTFGFNEKILEYEYAKKIAKALEVDAIRFHKLECEHYKDALTYLPTESLGHIANNHSHITSFLKSLSTPSNMTHISNYYSDAIFGYATHLPKKSLLNDTNSYLEKLKNAKFIKNEIREQILLDIEKLLCGYDHSSNFSSQSEYIYLTERNPKFHLNLVNCQDKFITTLTPFVDFELLKFMLSIPLKYKEQKIILDEIFKLFFPSISQENIGEISSRFSPRFSKNIDWITFRYFNLINSILRKFSYGKIQISNKFQTEEQDKLLYTCFHKELKQATKNFYELGLIDTATKKYFNNIPLRAIGGDQRYTLISINRLICNKTTS